MRGQRPQHGLHVGTGVEVDLREDGDQPVGGGVGDEQVVTTPSVAEPDDEPQFRFGLGETRRYE